MDFNLSCQCGKVRGIARNVPLRRTGRFVCMCDDCQMFAHFLKREDVLDQNGGTEIVPLYPADIEFTEGQEYLKCVRLYPKGLYRWYTDCCHTPVANIPQSPGIPYAGVIHAFIVGGKKSLKQQLGEVKARINGRFGKGELPPGTQKKVSIKTFLLNIFPFTFIGKVLKKEKPSPFFKNDLPACEPKVLIHEERVEIRKKL